MVANPPDRPLLAYDGDCSFCRIWVERWRTITRDEVQYKPWQEIAARFPQIPSGSFAKSVQLILPSGEVFSGAHAVFRTLAHAPRRRWTLWAYLCLPAVAPVSEWTYQFVAQRRNFLYKLTRLLWGEHFERPSFDLSRWLFLRLLGVVYFFAFLSISTQILGLAGSDGIQPAAQFLRLAKSQFGLERYWYFPTLAWLNASDPALQMLAMGGVFFSVLLILDIAPGPLATLLWIDYLSIVTVGQDFLMFQWDSLLLEAGFLAVFFAPWRLRRTASKDPPPSRMFIWVYRLLLFRLMFSSGAVKRLSGDPTWRSLTALEYHYETQPLPTPLAWYMHLLPTWFQQASVVFVLSVELFVPFLIFAPRRLRFLGGGVLILLQVLIALTGNYAFFNLLTVALCLLLFDDASLARIFSMRVAAHIRKITTQARPSRLRRWVTAPLAVLIALAGLCQLGELLLDGELPRPALRLLNTVEAVHIVNSYGLFAVMTTTRPEIIIEGSNDGQTWLPYEFKDKPGDLRRAPPWVAPFQPRLDWQMWFAALGDYRTQPWFPNFIFRLLQGSPSVLGLLAKNPFPQAPPRYIRALVYQYHFTDWATRRATGRWWTRELLRSYFPAVTLERSTGSSGP